VCSWQCTDNVSNFLFHQRPIRHALPRNRAAHGDLPKEQSFNDISGNGRRENTCPELISNTCACSSVSCFQQNTESKLSSICCSFTPSRASFRYFSQSPIPGKGIHLIDLLEAIRTGITTIETHRGKADPSGMRPLRDLPREALRCRKPNLCKALGNTAASTRHLSPAYRYIPPHTSVNAGTGPSSKNSH
jgi:hypothetical protein